MSINKDSQKAPNLRFKGFTDDWEQRKLGEISESYSGGTPSVSNHSYYGGSIPFIRSAEINSKNTELYLTDEGLNNSSAKLVEVGDILYALYGATSGEVGISQINGAINQAILAIQPKSEYDPNFIMQWLRRQKNSIISTYLQGGQGNLSGGIVKDLTLYAPTEYEEQKKIGQFFKQLDDTITLHQRKLNQLIQLKEALLQQMFPDKGKTVPKLRFAGFEGDWEERKLGEISEMYQPQTITGNDLTDSGYPVFGANGYIGYFSKYNHKSSQVTISARGEGTGTPSYVDGPVWITGNSMVINVDKNGINKMFLYTNLLSFSLKKYVTGGAQPQLVREVLTNVPIKIPSNEEQNKLGYFFGQLNANIINNKQKVSNLQSLKQVLLQNMFI